MRPVAVTPDGRYAISGSSDRTLKEWDLSTELKAGLETGREARTPAGHEGIVPAVAVAPDGRYDISGSWDGTLEVWDLSMELKAGLETGHEARPLAGHADSVNAVAVTPDGWCAVSASFDRTLKMWDLETGRELAMAALEGVSYCVAVASDGVTILVGDVAGNVYCLQYVEVNREATQ